MRKQQLANPLKHKNKGQSLIELTLILLVLLILLTGMVEFGNLLNQYINLVDGAREGARFGAIDDPFAIEGGVSNYEPFFDKIYKTVQGTYDAATNPTGTRGAINPIILNPVCGAKEASFTPPKCDDIVVTFFSVVSNGTVDDKTLTPFVSGLGGGSRYGHQQSWFKSNSYKQIKDTLDGTAPSAGVLLVEVMYNYHQILQLYSILGIPDPILVHAYSIMPLSSAEPTATLPPGP
jgi:hypothetical protein